MQVCARKQSFRKPPGVNGGAGTEAPVSACRALVFVSVPCSFKSEHLVIYCRVLGGGGAGKERRVWDEGTRLTDEACSPLSSWGHKKRKRFGREDVEREHPRKMSVEWLGCLNIVL